MAPYHGLANLTLGTRIEDDAVTFELYVAGEQPIDAIPLTSAAVSRLTGEVIEVAVHLSPDEIA